MLKSAQTITRRYFKQFNMELNPNMSHQTPLERTVIEAWVQRQAAALEAKDATTIGAGLRPDICFVWLATQWTGRNQAQAAIERYLAGCQSVRFHLRRLLVDAAHQTAAAEWVCRYIDQATNACREILGATVLDFDQNGLLSHGRTYLDPVRSGVVSGLKAPWPDEGWLPSQNPGPPPSRAFAEALIHANARAWSSHDLDHLNEVIHDEICICPPWDYQQGRAAVQKGAQIYFANYRDTQVTPRRFIIDPTQPYFGACEQTFACTNPDTGRRGEDHDFAFFEIAGDRLRFWRTYFDTSHSVQTVEKTAGFVQRQHMAGQGS